MSELVGRVRRMIGSHWLSLEALPKPRHNYKLTKIIMKLEIKCLCSELESEAYYLNKCSGENQIGKEDTKYGYKATHIVEDKKVVLTFNQYSNGEDDYDDELVSVEVSPIRSLLEELQYWVNVDPMSLLGK